VVALSISRLLVNAALNIGLLVWFDMGVKGVLWGNLLTATLACPCLFAVIWFSLGSPRLHTSYVSPLARFGFPLVATALLTTLMHQMDRLLLRLFLDLELVGIYSIAFTLGQGINNLYLIPFHNIWSVVIYDMARHEDAGREYARVFQYFVSGLLLLMLGVSMIAEPLLLLLVADDFRRAGELIPILCLAFVLYSLHSHFAVPALLGKRSDLLIPASVLAVLANVALNVILIPRWGTMGAAVASVGTYFIFSFSGLAIYRRLARYPYPLLRMSLVLVGVIVSYLLWSRLQALPWRVVGGVFIWGAWGAALFWTPLKQWACSRATRTRFAE
jgi:O-antigen/teichoic acid export membrane protein